MSREKSRETGKAVVLAVWGTSLSYSKALPIAILRVFGLQRSEETPGDLTPEPNLDLHGLRNPN